MEYALINLSTNEILDKKVFDDTPPDISHKGIKWLPIKITRPACNIDSQTEEGPTITVTESSVNIDYTVRTLTQQEVREKNYNSIDQQLFGKDQHTGNFLLMMYNNLRQSQSQPILSKSEFINQVLDTVYFPPETEENLIQYDKSGNPIT